MDSSELFYKHIEEKPGAVVHCEVVEGYHGDLGVYLPSELVDEARRG
jgi:hypothetical protein